MDPIENKQYEKSSHNQSQFATFVKDESQKVQLSKLQQDVINKDKSLAEKTILKSSNLFIIAALIMAGCGLLLKIFGATNENTTLDGFRGAMILLVLGLMASCENSNRTVGRIGYHLSLATAAIFGLNFLRLGYKWFDPTLWWKIAPLLSVTMGCSALFAFYKVCRARRDRSGSLFAIGCILVAIAAAIRWNEGQGLSAIDLSYSIAIICLIIPAVIFRFREPIAEYFREKFLLAPMAFAGLLIIAGAVKFSSNLLPQGATANAIEMLLDEHEPATAENKSTTDKLPESNQDQPESN